MKKALPVGKEILLQRDRYGNVQPWFFFAEEIVEFSNIENQGEPVIELVRKKIRNWMNRYLDEGVTECLLDDLNHTLKDIRYSKYVVPSDLFTRTEFPKNAYVEQLESTLKPEVSAANDFSKLLVTGQLKRLKICQLDDCDNFFLGPPQARWCSKTCGSKYRVRKKRKRDSE